MAPARTSPDPAVASSGVPVGLSVALPDGEHVRLPAPFKSTTARLDRESLLAAARRSVWTSLPVVPSRRAASPG